MTGRFLLCGGSGLIGTALPALWSTRRVEAVHLSRRSHVQGVQAVQWNPTMGDLPTESVDGFDGVLHLAGESIASGRWTRARKERIRASRVQGTALLANRLAAAQERPRTLVCASAIGYYGDRGADVVNEESAAGTGFLADVAQEWEAAAQPARDAGIRVVHLRLGVVLSSSGGPLALMLPPFKFGLGGPIGSGDQYLSWVTLRDVVRSIDHVLNDDGLSGAINVVAPTPVSQRQFAASLGRVLRRPTVLPLPSWAVSLLLGEMGRELLLASTRVEPTRLKASGYAFEHDDLDTALRDLLI